MKENRRGNKGSILCFSHLRWNFVYQRPQHLLSRFAEQGNFEVLFLEEPIFDAAPGSTPLLNFEKQSSGVRVGVPHLQPGLSPQEVNSALTTLLDAFLKGKDLQEFTFWYYTPMALSFSDKYTAGLTVFDCMDELSAFKFAPPELKDMEKRMLAKADVVFTGGQSIYEAKKHQHANIHAFPSSIDKAHFGQARSQGAEPQDQAGIKGPKMGFYGVIDERFDIDLIKAIAESKPEWQLMLLGPVVKIDPATLPQLPNIHYLGGKNYQELPAYLSGWDVALIPFAINESTRFISPTKTPEYLAGGVPVVSTPIRDVVHPYGIEKLVHIGSTNEEFIEGIEKALQQKQDKEWLAHVDHFLKDNCWNNTFLQMHSLMKAARKTQTSIPIAS
ncbi:glycosyltransferase family 1 protein [Mucilaginibacter koreensis]